VTTRGARLGWEITVRDHDWIDEGAAWQWEMPAKAAPFWRRWGIRHVRAFGVELWAWLTFMPTEPEWRALWRAEWVAYAIRRGWC
jgi:hypothetical protein